MSNGKGSNSKRPIDAAFGTESNQKGRQTRRKRLKSSKVQQEFAPKPTSTASKDNPSILQNEPPETQRSSNSGRTHSRPEYATADTANREPRGHERGKHMKKRPRKQRSLSSDWSLSAAEGGRFADHDPILVQGDRLVISRIFPIKSLI